MLLFLDFWIAAGIRVTNFNRHEERFNFFAINLVLNRGLPQSRTLREAETPVRFDPLR